MTGSMLIGNHMLVFHSQQKGKVRIELLNPSGKQLAETYEPCDELKRLIALITA